MSRAPFLKLIGVFLLAVAATASAQVSDVLKILAAEADVILVATVTEPPEYYEGSAPIIPHAPIVSWQESSAKVAVVETLKGHAETDTPVIRLRVPCVFESWESVPVAATLVNVAAPPLVYDGRPGEDLMKRLTATYAKGTKFIMFLKDSRLHRELGGGAQNGAPQQLIAWDPWYSCQRYDRTVELALRQIMQAGK